MSSHDPFWGMPEENWQPTSSFNSPIAPPLDDPLVGPLVQLPCVNQQWVPIILGCLSQLTDPGVWLESLSDDARSLVLNRVDNLRSAMAGTVSTPCCSVQMRLTAACELQYSVDGGATWTTVSGWDVEFPSCVQAQIIAPVPPNPGPSPTQQHACNIAGFLAQEIIQKTMAAMVAYVGSTNEQVAFAHDVLSSIGFAFPITYAFSNAAYDFYQSVVGQLLAQVEAARDDPALWSDVTCAIFAAIKNDGYVNAANFSLAQANLHAMGYSPAWVDNAIGNYWGDLGLANIQALQNVGALDDVDCTSCAQPWCYYQDLTANNGGWSVYSSGYPGIYIPGVGWRTTDVSPLFAEMVLKLDMGVVQQITEIQLYLSSTQGSTGVHISDAQVRNPLGTAICVSNFTYPANAPAYAWQNVVLGCSGRYLVLDIATAWAGGSGQTTLAGVQIRGIGVNPFGADNCIVGP